jgi:uncharacterized membrane protein
MRLPGYLGRLKTDLDRWIAKGLVPAENRAAIIADAEAHQPQHSLSAILVILGVISLAAGAMAFIAANWTVIPKIGKLAIMFAALWGSFALAAMQITRGHPFFGHAALLLAVLLFGVNIMLIGQIYHIDAHFPDGVMIWALGALLAAILMNSQPALAAAMILGVVWTVMEVTGGGTVFHWVYLPFWAVTALLQHKQRWKAGFHLVVLSATVWMTVNTATLADYLNWGSAETLGLLTIKWLAIWSMARAMGEIGYPFATGLQRYALAFMLVGFFLLQMVTPERGIDYIWLGLSGLSGVLAVLLLLLGMSGRTLGIADLPATIAIVIAAIAYPFATAIDTALLGWLYAGLFIAVTIWLMSNGVRFRDGFTVNIALAAFGVQVFYVYVSTFGTLLGNAAFFITGGIILIALAFFIGRLSRRLGEERARGKAGGAP